jgi:hypothetical protein
LLACFQFGIDRRAMQAANVRRYFQFRL